MTGTVRPDEWHGDKWSHESIMDLQARMEPDGIKRVAGEWTSTLSKLDSLLTAFLEDVTAMISESWSGAGAREALSTMRAYVENSRVALGEATTLSTGLSVLAHATGQLQRQVVAPSTGAPVGRLGVPVGWRASVTDDLDLWERALEQVRTVYSDPAVQAGNAVAQLVGPRERLRFGSGPGLGEAGDSSRDEQAERAGDFLARWALGEPETNPQQTMPQGGAGMPLQVPLMVAGMPGNPFLGNDFGSRQKSGSGWTSSLKTMSTRSRTGCVIRSGMRTQPAARGSNRRHPRVVSRLPRTGYRRSVREQRRRVPAASVRGRRSGHGVR